MRQHSNYMVVGSETHVSHHEYPAESFTYNKEYLVSIYLWYHF